MNRLTRISVLTLLILSAATGNAENVTVAQDFDKMYRTDKTLTTDKDYLVGTTDFVTYTCSGTGAKFFMDHIYSKYVSIYLPSSTSAVTTTKIDDFCGLILNHLPIDKCTNIEVYVSADGVDFGEPISGSSIEYKKGEVEVNIPPGDYYVRVMNNSSTAVSIRKITFWQNHCPKCFDYYK